MLAFEPLAAAYEVPNFQAHLAAFSLPPVSYQALSWGSVTASSSSWAATLTMASPATLLFGDVAVWPAQLDRLRLGSPTEAYLVTPLPMVGESWDPEYRGR